MSNNQGAVHDEARSLALRLQHGTPVSRGLAYRLAQECAKIRNLELGRRLQCLLVINGLDSISVLADHLIRLFSSRGSLIEANQTFEKVVKPSLFTWSAIMTATVKLQKDDIAFQLHNSMIHGGVNPDNFLFSITLNTCGDRGSIELGRCMHDHVIGCSLQSDMVVGSSLIDMYSKRGSIEEARRVFDRLPNHNVVTWGAMIEGYAQLGRGFVALECFQNMQHEGIRPSKVTFFSIVKACGSMGFLGYGRCIHQQIMDYGFQSDMVLGSTLVDMYAKCASLDEARQAFEKLLNPDVIAWSALISGYARNGEGQLALEWFENMQYQGVKPDVVTWSSIIEGNIQSGEAVLALECFENMQLTGMKPNKVTFLSVLKACGIVGAMAQGMHFHKQIIESRFQVDCVVANALVDMYSKCGNLQAAQGVFNELSNQDLISWNAMTSGYAQVGNVFFAAGCFEKMQLSGKKPDQVSFNAILAACTHVGLVDEGYWYFKIMEEQYGILPDVRHNTCMVDLLGCAGYFKEAENLLFNVMHYDISTWKAMLNACQVYGNVDLGKQCFEKMVGSDCCSSATYVLMAGIYIAAHDKDKAISNNLKKHTP